MKFSVITVTMNDEIGLQNTLKSLSKFDKNLYQHIVVDGGSKDQTLKVLQGYNSRIDIWISETDKGIYDAMNKGIKLVDNPENIVSFLNSGDLALDDYFSEPKKCFLKNSKIDYCYGGIILTGKNHESLFLPKILRSNSEYLQRMPFPHPSLFVKKYIFLKIGDFNLKKKITADHEWCVRLIKSKTSGLRFDCPVVRFQLGGISLKFNSQLEVFQTAKSNGRNVLIASLFFFRQIITHFYYILKSKI
jgi:glycosyltransferase involved in cell wall biosynthesis